jgi:hypothetical protein
MNQPKSYLGRHTLYLEAVMASEEKTAQQILQDKGGDLYTVAGHLLIEQDGEFIGLLSIGDVVRSALRQRTRELEELQQVANWEYYAEWKPRQ